MIKKSIRRLLEVALTKTDYHLVAKGASGGERAAFADHLSTLFRTLGIDCVFDIGANRGGFRNFLRNEVGYQKLILSFEPVAHLAETILAASATDSVWHTLQVAMGDVAGVMPINVTRNDALSSFLRPSDDADGLFVQMKEHYAPTVEGYTVDHVEDITVRTIADVYTELQEEYGFKRPYLKIDTQGFDLKVLRGAGRYLSRFAAVQTELCMVPTYEDQTLYTHVLALLDREGFAISGMYPVIRDPFLRVVEMDCVLVGEPAGA